LLPVVEDNFSISGKMQNSFQLIRRSGDEVIQSLPFFLQIVPAGEEDNQVLVHAVSKVVDKVVDGLSLLFGVPADSGDKDNGMRARG